MIRLIRASNDSRASGPARRRSPRPGNGTHGSRIPRGWGAASFVLVCLVALVAPAAVVLTADEATINGAVTGLKDGRVLMSVKPDKGDPQAVKVPLADVVEIRFADSPKPPSKGSGDKNNSDPEKKPAKPPATPASPGRVVLSDGDRFGSAITAWADQKLTVKLGASGPAVNVPVDRVREAWWGNAERVREAKAASVPPGVEDVAYVEKEGKVHAVRVVVGGIDGDVIRVKYNGQDQKIKLERLVGVVLASADPKPDESLRQAIYWADGQVITGTWVGFDKAVEIETRWGERVKIPAKDVARIATRNGRLVYLSDLTPARVEQAPYFDRLMAYRNDTAWDGGPLRLADGVYAKGVATHSRCVLDYDLGGKFDRFKAKLGFQQPEGRAGRVGVRVLVDGKVAFENADFKGTDPVTPVEASVRGAAKLTLEVDFGADQDVGDRVVWGGARLMKSAGK